MKFRWHNMGSKPSRSKFGIRLRQTFVMGHILHCFPFVKCTWINNVKKELYQRSVCVIFPCHDSVSYHRKSSNVRKHIKFHVLFLKADCWQGTQCREAVTTFNHVSVVYWGYYQEKEKQESTWNFLLHVLISPLNLFSKKNLLKSLIRRLFCSKKHGVSH